jgi:STE24 endopeptidase
MTENKLDTDRQLRAKEYARINRQWMLLTLFFGAAYMALWLFAGWSVQLRSALQGLTENPWLQAAGFVAVFGGLFYLLSLPISYHTDYVLPHRYDLSTESRRGWWLDQLKGLLIGVPLGLLLVEVTYLILRSYPLSWWLWVAGFLLLFNVILANLAPVLVAPLFYHFTPLQETHPGLSQRLIRLAEQAGVHVKGVYQIDMSRRTKAANAALLGLGNTRRIALGDTLLDNFQDDEIETILAHELAHQLHRDIPLGILTGSAITLVGLYLANLGLQAGVNILGFLSPADLAAMPLVALILGGYGLITMPLENAYSRWRERKADHYALMATRKPAAFSSAMTRLANQNLADADPAGWVVFFLYSHPPLNQRIAMAQNYSAEMQ